MGYFAGRDFFEDPELIALTERVMAGDLTLAWFDAATEKVRCAPSDPRRGLTYADCSVGSYAHERIPEFVRAHYSMAARGSEIVPGLPDLGYTINRKSDVWADEVVPLYEEAKSRRWAPAVDIPWAGLAGVSLAPEIEAALLQLCTFLAEMALVAMEMPSRWVFSMNQEFLEVKSFLCTLMIDHARHVEVFRKRALVGGGLKRASTAGEQALKEILFAETYPEGSLSGNVLLGSLWVGILRHAAAVAPTEVDARIFRLCLQDIGRQVAYGVGHLRYLLWHQPERAPALHEYLDRTEHAFAGIAVSPELLEPLIVLSGGGTSKTAAREGARQVRASFQRTAREYLERLGAAGLERRRRSRLAEFF